MQPISVRAVIEHEGKFLLAQNKNLGGKWCLPGGKLDSDEDVLASLRREIIEETAVEPEIGQLLYVHQLLGANKRVDIIYHVSNGADFAQVDIRNTSHGAEELYGLEFVDIGSVEVLPAFLAEELPQLAANGFRGSARTRISR